MNTLSNAVIILGSLCALIGIVLVVIAKKNKSNTNVLVDRIDSLLPQTQCGQCEFPGCRPYATAISNKEADINRCSPGGEATIQKLADLLGCEPKPLSEEVASTKPKQIAVIEEQYCIGCVKCIQACPVDAIIGAKGQMHTIIPDLCTGCELCISPCPMDCIEMVETDPLMPWRVELSRKVSL